jgi:molybdopterin adenylyltransferase
LLHEWIKSPFESRYAVVPDDRLVIESTLKDFIDNDHCSLVITTGGTGPAARDVTPEATRAVCDRELPGFGELMRNVSLRFVPTAILSRQTAGTRGRCLIVNLPGRPKAIRENLEAVFPAIPYCIDLVGGSRIETDPERMKTYRPESSLTLSA